MPVSSADDRQSVDLQRDALIAAGVDERHIHSDKASGGCPTRQANQAHCPAHSFHAVRHWLPADLNGWPEPLAVSCITMATIAPEKKVSAAIDVMAHESPKRSAIRPADSAPIA